MKIEPNFSRSIAGAWEILSGSQGKPRKQTTAQDEINDKYHVYHQGSSNKRHKQQATNFGSEEIQQKVAIDNYQKRHDNPGYNLEGGKQKIYENISAKTFCTSSYFLRKAKYTVVISLIPVE